MATKPAKSVSITAAYVKSAITQLQRIKPQAFDAQQEERLRDIRVQTKILEDYPVKKLVALLKTGTVRPHTRQRNHERDLQLGRSEHVTKRLSLSHTELVLCFWNGHWDFVDGNHRVKFWADYNSGEAPTVVNLILKFPKTPEQYIGLFFEYDSSAAHKGSNDHLEGILNALGLLQELKSPMFLDGAFWGAAWRLAGTKNLDAVYRSCEAHQAAFKKLDKHRFRASHLPMGGMLAAVELYHEEDEQLVWEFIVDFRNAYASGIKKSASGFSSSIPEVEDLMDFILAYRKEFGKTKPISGYGLSGEDAVPYVRQHTLGCFQAFKERREAERKLLSKATKAKRSRSA